MIRRPLLSNAYASIVGAISAAAPVAAVAATVSAAAVASVVPTLATTTPTAALRSITPAIPAAFVPAVLALVSATAPATVISVTPATVPLALVASIPVSIPVAMSTVIATTAPIEVTASEVWHPVACLVVPVIVRNDGAAGKKCCRGDGEHEKGFHRGCRLQADDLPQGYRPPHPLVVRIGVAEHEVPA